MKISYNCGKEHSTSVDLTLQRFAIPEGAKDGLHRDPTQGYRACSFQVVHLLLLVCLFFNSVVDGPSQTISEPIKLSQTRAQSP
jgi:hypothetical protein